MKKIILSALLLIPLLLSGCGGTLSAPDFLPLQAFSLSMTVRIHEKDFRGALTCRSYEEIEVDFTDPPGLSVFSVRTEGEGYAVRIGEYEDDVAKDFWPAGAPLRLLIETVRTAVFTNHGAFAPDGETGGYSAPLTVCGAPVTAFFDRDGMLTEIRSESFQAVFAELP